MLSVDQLRALYDAIKERSSVEIPFPSTKAAHSFRFEIYNVKKKLLRRLPHYALLTEECEFAIQGNLLICRKIGHDKKTLDILAAAGIVTSDLTYSQEMDEALIAANLASTFPPSLTEPPTTTITEPPDSLTLTLSAFGFNPSPSPSPSPSPVPSSPSHTQVKPKAEPTHSSIHQEKSENGKSSE